MALSSSIRRLSVLGLDWDLLEQLLTLEITPVGATELESYQQWVVDPVVPSSVKEVGPGLSLI